MGFTPHQARIALAATDSGLDVDQALETLLSNIEEAPNTEVEARDLDISTAPVRRANRPPPPRTTRSADSPRQGGDESPIGPSYQEQADRLISQATIIGRGMFNKANAFWKESKERVQKAYEEHQVQQGSSRSDVRRDGRPRWMIDDHQDDGSKDDHDAPFEYREYTERSGMLDSPSK